RGTGVRLITMRGIEHGKQQLLPAREEQGAIIKLDLQHVARDEMTPRAEIVADLLRARTLVVPAIAKQLQRVAENHALVGAPDARIGGILDARILRGRGVAGPARARFGPIRR